MQKYLGAVLDCDGCIEFRFEFFDDCYADAEVHARHISEAWSNFYGEKYFYTLEN